MNHRLKSNSPIGICNVVQELVGVFANERFFVVASNVVPGNAIVVHVVENWQASFVGSVDVEFGVVGLSEFFVSSLGPGVEAPALRCLVRGGHLFAVRGPEPPEDRLGLEIASVFASLEVAETTGRPNVWYVVLLHEFEHEIILFLGFHGNQVHAVFPANIPGV